MTFRVFVLLLMVTAPLGAVSFDEGRDAFAKQDWKAAVSLLARFGADHPDDPQAPAAAFLRGVALYQTGDYRASLDAFQKLDRTWPQSTFAPRLPYWKGTAALAAGQFDLAERELSAQAQYPHEEPFYTRALLNLGLTRVALKKNGPASEVLEAFTARSTEAPLLSQAWSVLADLDRAAGQVDRALERYRRSWEAEPGGKWDQSSRAQADDLLLTSARWAEARDLAEASISLPGADRDRWDDRRIAGARGLGDTKTVLNLLEGRWSREKSAAARQLLASNRARAAEDAGAPDPLWWGRASLGPDEALGLASVLRQASLLEAAGRVDQAAAALETWAGRPGLGAGAKETAFDRAASDRRVAGDAANARKLWSLLLSTAPKSPSVPKWLLSRGRLYLEAGDTTAALTDFSRLLKDFPKAPEAPEARYQTGVVYLQRQEPARAEGWFYGLVQDLKAGDLYERALLARGVCFVNSGQADLARGSLNRLLREDPLGPWVGAAWAALGRNAVQARVWDEALSAYQQAVASAATPADRADATWALAEVQATAGQIDAAAATYGQFAQTYASDRRAGDALYRRGQVRLSAHDPEGALAAWDDALGQVKGEVARNIREGQALAELQAHRPDQAWARLVPLDPSPEVADVWYRWGLAALAAGEADAANRAFEHLLQTYPQSSAAEAALPRAAGALLTGGKAEEALARYASYFAKTGTQAAAAPVARAAASAALPYPATLEALVKASARWTLAPEVRTEFSLVWAQSRLDTDPAAVIELQGLAQTAPWSAQRSTALTILGRWHLAQGRTTEARSALEAAANLGDDVSVFQARWALAQVTAKEGDRITAAKQMELVEKSAGSGVPREFRQRLLAEAADLWDKSGRGEEAQRVRARLVP